MGKGQKLKAIWGDKSEKFEVSCDGLLVGELQKFLDKSGFEVDYIHGADALAELAKKDGACGFLLPSPDKSALFKTVISDGALPRKTFSMGEANEKRYYMEAKLIKTY